MRNWVKKAGMASLSAVPWHPESAEGARVEVYTEEHAHCLISETKPEGFGFHAA